MSDIDTFLRLVFNPELPFGGIHVVALGDFCQLPPVDKYKGRQPSLFTTEFLRHDLGNGRLLWLQFKVVVLTELKRAQDPLLKEILDALRTGDVTPSQHMVLLSRVIHRVTHEEKIKFITQGRIITPANIVKNALSHLFVFSTPTTSPTRPLLVHAVDRFASSRVKNTTGGKRNRSDRSSQVETTQITDELQLKLWKMPDSQTGQRNGALLLRPAGNFVLQHSS